MKKVYCKNCKWCYSIKDLKRKFCVLFFTREFSKKI